MPAPCVNETHFAGTYVGTNVFQHDTIEIIFNSMNASCKRDMTIKGLHKPYNYVTNTNGCNSILNQDYQILDDMITSCNAKLIDNVWSNNGITNDNDISIIMYNCNSNQLNFKKIN